MTNQYVLSLHHYRIHRSRSPFSLQVFQSSPTTLHFQSAAPPALKAHTLEGKYYLLNTNSNQQNWIRWIHEIPDRNVSTASKTFLRVSYPVPTQLFPKIVPLRDLMKTPFCNTPCNTHCHLKKLPSNASEQLPFTLFVHGISSANRLMSTYWYPLAIYSSTLTSSPSFQVYSRIP